MFYDPERKRTLFVGGMSDDRWQTFDEVWDWDGETWRNVSPDIALRRPWQNPYAAFDRTHNRVVQSPVPALGEIGVRIGDFHAKPAQLASFSLDSLAPPSRKAAIDAVTVSAHSGAISTVRGKALTGAMLHVWDGATWRAAACNAAAEDAPEPISVSTHDPHVIGRMQVRGALQLALSPIAEHGDGPLATIASDYVEVRVR